MTRALLLTILILTNYVGGTDAMTDINIYDLTGNYIDSFNLSEDVAPSGIAYDELSSSEEFLVCSSGSICRYEIDTGDYIGTCQSPYDDHRRLDIVGNTVWAVVGDNAVVRYLDQPPNVLTETGYYLFDNRITGVAGVSDERFWVSEWTSSDRVDLFEYNTIDLDTVERVGYAPPNRGLYYSLDHGAYLGYSDVLIAVFDAVGEPYIHIFIKDEDDWHFHGEFEILSGYTSDGGITSISQDTIYIAGHLPLTSIIGGSLGQIKAGFK